MNPARKAGKYAMNVIKTSNKANERRGIEGFFGSPGRGLSCPAAGNGVAVFMSWEEVLRTKRLAGGSPASHGIDWFLQRSLSSEPPPDNTGFRPTWYRR